MRLNESLSIQTRHRTIPLMLVPYMAEHVPLYNDWMQDDELLRLTCSERLSLAEEFENQQSWQEDPGKLTFILCSGLTPSLTNGMAGDVNAFFSEDFPSEDGSESGTSQIQGCPALHAELEIMIAEPEHRRKGLARDTLSLFMHFVMTHVPRVDTFVAKVTDDNEASLGLFLGLGFQVFKHMPVFQQTELRLSVSCIRPALEITWAELGAVCVPI